MNYSKLSKAELAARLKAERAARRELERERESNYEAKRLVDDLRIHQVELEAQNLALREAQSELESSRMRYADLYDFAPIPYCSFSREGVVLQGNFAAAGLFGRERARMIGRPFVGMVILDHVDAFFAHVRECFGSEIAVTTELTLKANGRRLDFQLVSRAARDLGGQPVECRTAFLDISERRRAERERVERATEQGMRERLEIVDRASLIITRALANVSKDGLSELLRVIVEQVREVTRADYAALGISRGSGKQFEPWSFSGMSQAHAVRIGKAPREVGLLGKVVRAERPIRLSDVRDHPSFSGLPGRHPALGPFLGAPIRYHRQSRGALYVANERGHSEFTEADRILIGMLAARVAPAIEIARLRQIELRERARLEFLAKAGPILSETIEYEPTLRAIAGLVVPSLADLSIVDLLYPDGSLEKIALCHRDPAFQPQIDQLLGVTSPGDVPAEVRAAIDMAKPQRSSVTPEFSRNHLAADTFREIVRAIGATSGIAAPLVLRNRVIGVLRLIMTTSGRTFSDADLSLAQDVAHHAALAIEDARLYRAAQEASRTRDELLAVVSHDLRNYLSTIRMGAGVVAHKIAEMDQPKMVHLMDSVQRAANRMERLINGLRDATMIETGRFTLHPKSQDLAALLDDAVKMLSPQADARKQRLSVALPKHLPPVRCDPERVEQVIANLVGNAIKFSPEQGKIRIAAKRQNGWVRISVTDSGAGIPKDKLPKVFERHWSGGGGGRKSTGLGLFIARGIVQAHGGLIDVMSTEGAGSTFYFTLPVEAAEGSGSSSA